MGEEPGHRIGRKYCIAGECKKKTELGRIICHIHRARQLTLGEHYFADEEYRADRLRKQVYAAATDGSKVREPKAPNPKKRWSKKSGLRGNYPAKI